MNIDETQLHNWRNELAGQRFEGAYLTRTQTFSVTALVSLVSAAGSQIPDMLPFEIEEVPGTKEAQEREEAVASEGETETGVLEGEDKTAQEKHEERQATTKTATKEEKPQSSAQRAQAATTSSKEKASEKSSSSSKSSKK